MGRPRQEVKPDPGPALLALYDQALPQVYGYLLSRCGRRALAEDLTAETFLAAVEAVRKEAPPDLSAA
ncbi:RNA polymerase sigma factor, partial [Actinomadura adrarensis]